ncbi:MAG TPA: M57 family metalloprotease, partial [Kofleriaceae bacterium]|nr:M57 family metalloprotease [Kofleriaceae bacterium]
FQAQATVDPGGTYVVNGDELAENLDQLHDAYQNYLATVDAEEAAENGIGTIEQGLIVNRVGGRDDKWSASAALNITYCVSQSSFGSRFNSVVSAMSGASGAWEGAAHVNFVHSSGQDGNCTRNNNSVVFNVRQVSGAGFLARSFFPSSSRRNREVLIDSTSFGNISPWTLTGVLRHELGHTLGFRHEHTRPEAGGVCFEDNNWRALTTYDSSSVMHYPQCNGTQGGDLVLTTRDRQGAAALYGSP